MVTEKSNFLSKGKVTSKCKNNKSSKNEIGKVSPPRPFLRKPALDYTPLLHIFNFSGRPTPSGQLIKNFIILQKQPTELFYKISAFNNFDRKTMLSYWFLSFSLLLILRRRISVLTSLVQKNLRADQELHIHCHTSI